MAAKRDAKGRFLKGVQPETGFKPGQSGNPKGRLPRVVEDTYLQALYGVVPIPEWEEACKAMLIEAKDGNVRAWEALAKYTMPQPKQGLEVTGANGQALQTEITIRYAGDSATDAATVADAD